MTAGANQIPALTVRRLHKTAEGAFYVWTKNEIDDALGDSAEVFDFHYGVQAQATHRKEAIRTMNSAGKTF